MKQSRSLVIKRVHFKSLVTLYIMTLKYSLLVYPIGMMVTREACKRIMCACACACGAKRLNV